MTSVRDIIVIAVILFATGICITFAMMVGHRVNTNLLLQPTIANNTDAVSVITHSDAAINTTDYLYLAFFIGLFVSIIIFGYLVGGSPVFAPIYFFLVVIFTFVSVILQLAWIDLATNPEVITTMVNMPLTNFILAHLGIFMAVFGLVGIVVMFAKPQDGGTSY
jgi:hypothetical protein